MLFRKKTKKNINPKKIIKPNPEYALENLLRLEMASKEVRDKHSSQRLKIDD
jgi:hypothetical protein